MPQMSKRLRLAMLLMKNLPVAYLCRPTAGVDWTQGLTESFLGSGR